MGYRPWGPKELDMTEHACSHTGIQYSWKKGTRGLLLWKECQDRFSEDKVYIYASFCVRMGGWGNNSIDFNFVLRTS